MQSAAGMALPTSFEMPPVGSSTEQVLLAMIEHVRHCAQVFVEHHQHAVKCRFTRTFDPDTQWQDLCSFLDRFGFVVLRNVCDEAPCRALCARIDEWLASLGTGVVARRWDTYTNEAMPDGVVTMGTLEGLAWPPPNVTLQDTSQPRARFDPVTHCSDAWRLRTDERLHRVFARLLNENDLRVSVDRLLYQRPMIKRPAAVQESWRCYERRPTLEYNVHHQAKHAKHDIGAGAGYQAVVALVHADSDSGAPVVCPGFAALYALFSHCHRGAWADSAPPLRLDPSASPLVKTLIANHGVMVPMQRGHVLLLDRRVPRWGSPNVRGADAFAALCVRYFQPTAAASQQAHLYATALRHGLRFTHSADVTGHCGGSVRATGARPPAHVYAQYTPPELDTRQRQLAGLIAAPPGGGATSVPAAGEETRAESSSDDDDDDEDDGDFAASLTRYLLKRK